MSKLEQLEQLIVSQSKKGHTLHLGGRRFERAHDPVCMIGRIKKSNKYAIIAGERDCWGSFKSKNRNRIVVTVDDLENHSQSKRVKKLFEIANVIQNKNQKPPITNYDSLVDEFIDSITITKRMEVEIA
ncbi:MAG: hypothetical protein H6766_03985 [Candidatus Peribacteria bacterium]|nr:MAG: hypothetical protein H6766_03985 [Candidatus Peribacteria bacterium]